MDIDNPVALSMSACCLDLVTPTQHHGQRIASLDVVRQPGPKCPLISNTPWPTSATSPRLQNLAFAGL